MNATGAGLRALLYADWRMFVNDARDIVRRPARLTIWAAYLAMMAWFLARRSGRSYASHGIAPLTAGADYFAAINILFIAAALGFSMRLALFRHRAEARRIIGSPLEPRVAIAYVVVRSSLGDTVRRMVSLGFSLVIFLGGLPLATLAYDAVLVVGLLAMTIALKVVRVLLAPRAKRVATAVAAVLALYAVVAIVRRSVLLFVASSPARDAFVHATAVCRPGGIFLTPGFLPVAAIGLLFALAIAEVWALAADAYPELYASNEMSFNLTERKGHGRAAITDAILTEAMRSGKIKAAPTARASRWSAPGGAAILIWKSFVTQWRNARPWYVAGGAACWLAAGASFARLSPTASALVASIALPFAALFVVVDIGGFAAADLRSPLFRLGDTSLFERLIALAFAGSWRRSLTVALIVVGHAAAFGDVTRTLEISAIIPLVVLSSSVAIAAFAVAPAAADRAGPVVLVRLGVFVLSALTCGIAGALAALLLPLSAAIVIASIIAVVESGIALAIATACIEGRSDRLARS